MEVPRPLAVRGLYRNRLERARVNRQPQIASVRKGASAVLHLNGREVGRVEVRGWDASWTFGQFTPDVAFSPFAPIFGRWSLLMHEDEHAPLGRDASEALREAEQLMDELRARIYFPDDDAWHDVAQLNIDGGLIEWKEF